MMDQQEMRLGAALDGMMPEVPEVFKRSMEKTLSGIVSAEKAQSRPRMHRTLLVALVLVVLLASVAIAAAFRNNVFEALLGVTPENGRTLIQHDLAKVSFAEVDVEVKEAAYDGMSLYILYSIRDRNATKPLGEYDKDFKGWLLSEETMPAMQRDNVGWWSDNIWINGERVSMPNMSSGITTGSETPGELLFYQLYRLDQEGIFLSGETVVGLPILKRVDYSTLARDENGRAVLPEGDENILYFTMDTSAREGVTVEEPNIVATWDSMRAWASNVTYSPIKLYITVDMDVEQEAIDALGEGFKDEQGNVLFPPSAVDITSVWAFSALLVDKDGERVFETMEGFGNGCQGCGDTQAYFQFPYSSDYPDEMYLAPMDGDVADMARAVRVR